LKNPEETIRYVLQLKGLLQEEEKYELSPAFLMEMMELNELVMEADGDAGALQSVTRAIDQFKQDIYEPVKKIMANYQEGVTSEEELLQVKEYYFKRKYLDRITSSRA
jgi:molecular chaperone HscB